MSVARKLEETWLSDDPLERLDDELFGRAHLIERCLEVLARVSAQSGSSTIGLVGAWGSGKSSIINGLVEKLTKPDESTSQIMGRKWAIAEFNPWLFAGPTALYQGFFASLRKALPEDSRWNTTKEDLIKFGRKMTPLAALAGLAGVDGQGAANAALDLAADDVVQTRNKVAAALTKLEQPILVVLDDLDRLTAEELLHVFKLVRLVGRLPHVYYLLSYDEHTLVDLLSHTDLVSAGDERRALDYLEKIVQVRIDMPLLRPFEVDRVVAEAIAFLAKKHEIRLEQRERQEIIQRFDAVLSKRLRSPRAIKRVFGQVDAFLGSMGAEVDYGDYLVVTWLRTMEPGVYLLLQTRRAELLGAGSALRHMDAPARTAQERRADWLRSLKDSHVADADADDIMWLVGTLFDSVARVYKSEEPDKTSTSQREPGQGKIQHPDYFDRFFAFGVPADDLPDAVADGAVRDVGAGDMYSAHVQRVFDTFVEQPDLALSKLHRSIGAAEALEPKVFAWLKVLWESADRLFVRGRVENLAALALDKVDEGHIEAVVQELMGSDAGLNYIAATRQSLGADAYGARAALEERARLADMLGPLVDARFRERYEQLLGETDSPFSLNPWAHDTVWYWRYQDPKGLRDFLSRAMNAGWPVVDTLAWLVPTSTSDGVNYTVGRHMSFGHFRELFDLEAVGATIADELSDADEAATLQETDATPDALRAWALAAVKKLSPPQAAPDA